MYRICSLERSIKSLIFFRFLFILYDWTHFWIDIWNTRVEISVKMFISVWEKFIKWTPSYFTALKQSYFVDFTYCGLLLEPSNKWGNTNRKKWIKLAKLSYRYSKKTCRSGHESRCLWLEGRPQGLVLWFQLDMQRIVRNSFFSLLQSRCRLLWRN